MTSGDCDVYRRLPAVISVLRNRAEIPARRSGRAVHIRVGLQ